jgi:para-aminobenzoate synthetase component 2
LIYIIDHYDSFTFNLVQQIGGLGIELMVVRNDQTSIEAIEALQPSLLLFSPGPCTPNETGVSLDIIRHFAGKIPQFGVCLGHQSMAHVFGGNVIRAKEQMHGKTSLIYHDGKTIFSSLPNPFEAMRYHSLLVERDSLPDCFEISAWTADGEIMAMRHREYKIESVQFHPESIMTIEGTKILANVIKQFT